VTVASVDAVDSLGCRIYLGATGQRLASQRSTVQPLHVTEVPRAIYLVASGALGLAFDAVQAWMNLHTSVPIIRVATHDAVAFVPDAVLVAASFAGDTPEVLSHATRAIDAGIPVAALQVRGPLGDLVTGAGGTVVVLDGAAPGPRWAFLEAVISALLLLSGVLSDEARAALERELDRGVEEFRAVFFSPALEDELGAIVRQIDRTMVLSIGAGTMGGVVARRLACQIEENAKTLAFPLRLPDLAYSTIAGFGQGGDITRQVFTVLSFHRPSDDPCDERRRALLDDVLDEQVSSRHDLELPVGGPLVELLHGVAISDLISLGLAAHVGIDPGPVPAIVEMKAVVVE
jgi:glucose/mannose-6-phosphate isomerase